jgi:hypothetical protein
MKGCYSLILGTVYLLASCGKSEIVLNSVSVPREASLIKLDSNTNYSLNMYNVSVRKPLGKMESYFVVTTDTPFPKKGFRIVEDKNGVRISNDFLAIVKPFGKKNWGWFRVNNGKINNTLSHVDRLVDSLQAAYGNGYFVRHTNGTIDILKEGKKIRSYDYGDLLYDSIVTNSLTMLPGLYQVKNKVLTLVSNDPDDLFRQKDGEYYVPPPGYGVIKKVRKAILYRTIDSILRLTPIPTSIKIPVE